MAFVDRSSGNTTCVAGLSVAAASAGQEPPPPGQGTPCRARRPQPGLSGETSVDLLLLFSAATRRAFRPETVARPGTDRGSGKGGDRRNGPSPLRRSFHLL